MPTSYPNTRAFFSIIARQRDAFAALPVHILSRHVLSSRNLPDRSDLARLRAVSREMRAAVAATGRAVYPLEGWEVIQLGDLKTLRRMYLRGDLDDEFDSACIQVDDTLCNCAASEGQLEILKWAILEKDYPWNEGTFDSAALRGHLEVLQWLRAIGCPWDEDTCKNAARAGHFEMLQWLRANGCPWDFMTCSSAAGEGHLDVLQWLRANGCPWGNDTCTFSAEGGHLEVLQWAHANGCPWDENTIGYATRNRHFQVVSLARANGAPEHLPIYFPR